jgi:hypothetical protein
VYRPAPAPLVYQPAPAPVVYRPAPPPPPPPAPIAYKPAPAYVEPEYYDVNTFPIIFLIIFYSPHCHKKSLTVN